jgi:hypothetical protein
MITKTLLTTATAALIAAGSLGASTTTASAHWHGHHGGPGGIFFGDSGFSIGFVGPSGHKVCSPIIRTLKQWSPYYGWTFQNVVVGQDCHWEPYSYGYAW